MAEEKKERGEGIPTGSVPRTVEPASTVSFEEPAPAEAPVASPQPAPAPSPASASLKAGRPQLIVLLDPQPNGLLGNPQDVGNLGGM